MTVQRKKKETRDSSAGARAEADSGNKLPPGTSPKHASQKNDIGSAPNTKSGGSSTFTGGANLPPNITTETTISSNGIPLLKLLSEKKSRDTMEKKDPVANVNTTNKEGQGVAAPSASEAFPRNEPAKRQTASAKEETAGTPSRRRGNSDTGDKNKHRGSIPRRSSQTTTGMNAGEHSDRVMQMLSDIMNRTWEQIRGAAAFIMHDLGGNNVFDKIAQWCVRHPYLTIFSVAASVMVLLPFLIIFGFCVSALLMTFTGFMFIEGSLLTVVSLMLFGCLATVGITVLFFTVLGVAAYFGCAHVYASRRRVKSKTAVTPRSAETHRGSISESIADTNLQNASSEFIMDGEDSINSC